MKKLWNLSLLVVCAALVMAQLAHVSTAEASGCDTVQTEQHMSGASAASADQHAEKAAKEFCCESCHFQMVSIPLVTAEPEAPHRERSLFTPVSVSDVTPETLVDPPQA